MASPAGIEVVNPRQEDESAEKIGAESQQLKPSSDNEVRLSLVQAKRPSWNRALSTRGRTSIAASVRPPDQEKPRMKKKPPLPKGKNVQPPNFDKEIAYFKEIDSFELLEESPSPKKTAAWSMGVPTDPIPHLSSELLKWLDAQTRKNSCPRLPSLTRILETPASGKDSIVAYDCESCRLKESTRTYPHVYPNQMKIDFGPISESRSRNRIATESSAEKVVTVGEEISETLEAGVTKLSLASRPDSLSGQRWDPFSALLAACGQSAPSTFWDVLVNYRKSECIVKVGEGTFGEAFKVGGAVLKIVPFDGAVRINGEVQKKSEEMLEEVMLSSTLNHLRGCETHASNACTSFIQTMNLQVCRGPYDDALIEAWEKWDEEHGSENDNPKNISQNQCYVVFVQEHGGRDLESFELLNYDEARSILVQVTLALAVAEAAYEFEHRDLHWGNILVRRGNSENLCFTLEGRKIHVKTFGLSISIIDFTLSRLKTGDDILFLDLSLDPEIFDGPKGHIQFDTYRNMKKVTDECWEGSYPKTNVLWLEYLIHILMVNKSYKKSRKDRKDLKDFKNRLSDYNSAKEVVEDPFFSSLFIDY